MDFMRKFFDEAIVKRLFCTRWKDGIDIDEPTQGLIAFAKALKSQPAQPSIDCGVVCQAARDDGVTCPEDECDRENGCRPAIGDTKTQDWGVMRRAILEEFPLLDDKNLDPEKHHCELAIHQERLRLHSVIGAASLHMLIASCPKQPAQPSDTEMLDWLISNDASVNDSYKPGNWNVYGLPFANVTLGHKTPREAIKAAMRADREGS